MLRLRPYQEQDAATILQWVQDERAFRAWTADRYGAYPISPAQMNAHYAQRAQKGPFYGLTALEGDTIAGHLALRVMDAEATTVRFCYIIVDGARRGRGYGREMLGLAIRHAFHTLGAEKITLGVFEHNLPAYKCYLSLGFRRPPGGPALPYRILGEEWICLEMELLRP